MKKSKSKSKPKQKNLTQKQSEMIDQEIESKCGVCRTLVKPHHPTMTCDQCRRVTHAACYNSEQLGKKNFVCDMCKNKKRRQFCILCRQYGDVQILKCLDGNNAYIHVECAILSPHVEVQSYSKLGFVARGDLEKTNKHTAICSACGLTGAGVIIGCVECPKKAHFRCWIAELGDQNYLLYRWLDKFDKYDYLLNYVLTKKKTNLKTVVDMPNKLKQLQVALCSEHILKYPFCYCNNRELSQKNQHPDYECEQCGRWIHQPCSGLPPSSQQSFKCEGCREGNIFKRELKFHELLTEIARIQKSQKLNEKSIKLLNSFPLKYSGQLEKKIMESLKQIEVYFAKKQILRVLQSEANEEKKKKKITQLLLIINYGDKWKQYQGQLQREDLQSSKISSHILNLKSLFDKETEQKIGEVMRPKIVKPSKEYSILKEELKSFIKLCKSISVTNFEEAKVKLAIAIKEVQLKFVETFLNSEEKQKIFLTKFNEVMGNELFGFLISKKHISLETIKSALAKMNKINYFILKENNEISQDEYYNITQESIPEHQRALWAEIFGKMQAALSKLQVTFESVKKQQMYKKCLSEVKEIQDLRSVNRVQGECLKNQICTINNQGTFMALKMKAIEENVMKKKILAICRKKDSKLAEDSFKNVHKIQEFLKKKAHLFLPKELEEVTSYVGKLEFIIAIFKKGQFIQQYLIYDKPISEEMADENEIEGGVGPIFMKIFHILDNWDERSLPVQYFINELYSKCVLKKVKFSNPLVEERLKIFVRFVSNRYYNAMEEGRKIYSTLLKKFVKIFEYLNMEREFAYFIQLYERVKKWSNIFLGEQKYENISLALQKPEKATNLLRILEAKIATASQIEKVNLSIQVSKLCLLRQWCRLTEKILLLSKSKATINSIQTLRTLMEKVQYPQNLLQKKVVDLETESKNLNKEVLKFLQKPRHFDHMNFFDQIKFVCSKMLIEEGYYIKSILDKCNLDVYVQTQELQNEIKQFEALPNDLNLALEKKTILQLSLTRRKFLESCFRVSNIQDYEKFLRKIYIIRCNNFQPPILKEQYFQLLTVGGSAAIQFEAKTSQLLKAYRTIEKAELQISNPGNKKKNLNNLIPWSEQKCRQLRDALKVDPMQLMKFERARIINGKLRDEYIQMRMKKLEIQKYKEIELELSNSIFSNREILMDIGGLKIELERLIRRIEDYLPYQMPFPQLINGENIFRRERGLIETIAALKIKHPTLEKFEMDYRMYVQAELLRPNVTIQNYKAYCDSFIRMSDLACRIPEIVNSRTLLFVEIYRESMRDRKPPLLLCQTLITEGLELKRLGSNQKQLVFEMVLEIYNYLNEKEKQDDSGEEEEEIQQGKRERQYNNDNDEEDDSDMEDDEDGEIDDEDEDDEEDSDDDQDDHMNNMDGSDEASPEDKGNGKGGNNQIVLDSD